MDLKNNDISSSRKYPWYDDRVVMQLDDEESRDSVWPYNTLPPKEAYDTPKKIFEYLGNHVWKQDAAKRAASIITYNCFERGIKSNAIFVGPTAVGRAISGVVWEASFRTELRLWMEAI